ncbi:MAG: KAP family P-loop NTPase fold protein [Bacillota bacterium]
MTNLLKKKLEDPFQGDLFNREKQIRKLYKLILINKENFVTCIDSNFGRGKTTFFEMFNSYILSMNKGENEELIPIYYDAWENDYFDYPFISLVSCLDEAVKNKENVELNDIKSATSEIANGFVKMMTNGVLDLKSISKSMEKSDSNRSVIKEYLEIKNQMANIQDEFSNIGKGKKVFFIDELDRCKPSFALELLEIIKHFFDIDDYYFVLAIDKNQLYSTIRAKYGSEIDAPGYLKRFIDFDIRLTPINRKVYFRTLIENEYENFNYSMMMDTFDFLFTRKHGISLRDIDKIVVYLKLIIPNGKLEEFNIDNEYDLKKKTEQFLFAILLYLKVVNHKMYSNYIDKFSDSKDVREIHDFLFNDGSFSDDNVTEHSQNRKIFNGLDHIWEQILKYWRMNEIPEKSITNTVFSVSNTSLQVVDFMIKDKEIFYPDAIKLIQLIDDIDLD